MSNKIILFYCYFLFVLLIQVIQIQSRSCVVEDIGKVIGECNSDSRRESKI